MANWAKVSEPVWKFIKNKLSTIPTNPPGKSKIIKVEKEHNNIKNVVDSAAKIPQHLASADSTKVAYSLFVDKANSVKYAFDRWYVINTRHNAALAKYNKISNELRKAKNPPRIRRTRKPVDQKKVRDLTKKFRSARILRDSTKRTLNQKQRILFREIRLAAQRAIVVIAEFDGIKTKLGVS